MSKPVKRRKLSQFAKDEGLKYASAYNYWKAGALEGIQLKSGTILVEGWKQGSVVDIASDSHPIDLEDKQTEATERAVPVTAFPIHRDIEHPTAIIYSRASFSERKEQARAKSERLKKLATQLEYIVVDTIEEVGLAYSDKRIQLSALLARDDWDVLIVESKEELLKFGAPYVEILLKRLGKKIVTETEYLNPSTFEDSTSERELNSLIQKTRNLLQGLVGVGKHKAIIDELIQELIR